MMLTVDDYLFGNGAMHEEFRITTRILSALVSRTPRSVSIRQLQKDTGRTARELHRLCRALCEAMLLQPFGKKRDQWTLARTPNAITLEDVFRCIILKKNAVTAPAVDMQPKNDHVDHNVDLLLTQATMTINQAIAKHLRQFSMDRLKVSSRTGLRLEERGFRCAGFYNVDDFEVNAWLV